MDTTVLGEVEAQPWLCLHPHCFPHTKRGPSGVGAGHRADQPCFSTGVIP